MPGELLLPLHLVEYLAFRCPIISERCQFVLLPPGGRQVYIPERCTLAKIWRRLPAGSHRKLQSRIIRPGFIHELRRCRFPVGEAIAPARFMCGVLSFRSVSVSVSGSLSGALPCVTPALPVVSLLLSFPSAAAFSARFFSRKAFTRAAESSSRLGCRFAHPVTKSPSRTFPCIAARICSTCSMSRSKELAMSSAHRFLSSRVRLRFPALHLRYQSFHWHLMR